MGTKYTTNTATGYNSSPPGDDGSVSDANKGKWSTIKTKLADPTKNLADAMNTALVAALDVAVTTQSGAYSTLASDHQKPIYCTSSPTISLRDAATVGTGYQVTVVNVGTGIVTVGLVTALDTLNGTANGTIRLGPGQFLTVETNSTPNGYNVIAGVIPGTLVNAWMKVDSTGTISASKGVTSADDVGQGQVRANWTVAFSSAHYAANLSLASGANAFIPRINTQNAANCVFDCVDTNNDVQDPAFYHISASGIQ